MVGSANLTGHPALALDQRDHRHSDKPKAARPIGDGFAASGGYEFDGCENCLGRAGPGSGVWRLELHVYDAIAGRSLLGGGGGAMAGWPPRVCDQLGNRQHQCTAGIERAKFIERGIFIHAGGRAAGKICHPGFHKFLRLAIDQHEHRAGKRTDRNRGPRDGFAAVLSSDESALKGDAFLPAAAETEKGLSTFLPAHCRNENRFRLHIQVAQMNHRKRGT